MENIQHLDTYVKRMEKSCLDKLFFLDKIYDPIHTILDFGCANGALIQAMRMFSPDWNYIGHDISDEMLALARELLPDCRFYR